MRKSIIIASLCFITLIVITVSGCYNDKEDLLYPFSGKVDCTTISAKFSTDVKPMMQNKCATTGCHNAASRAGGTVLETYLQISGSAARTKQRCVVEKTMPPGAPLTPSEIAILTCWINSGAPNN